MWITERSVSLIFLSMSYLLSSKEISIMALSGGLFCFLSTFSWIDQLTSGKTRLFVPILPYACHPSQEPVIWGYEVMVQVSKTISSTLTAHFINTSCSILPRESCIFQMSYYREKETWKHDPYSTCFLPKRLQSLIFCQCPFSVQE